MRVVRHALVTALALMLVACATPMQREGDAAMPLPLVFRNATPSTPQFATLAMAASNSWWKHYGSAELNGLVDRALINNAELRISTLQIAQSKIRVEQVEAGNLPLLSAPLRVVSQGSGGTSDTQQSSQIALQGSYRVDVWGEQRASVESARMQVWRSVYEHENVQRNVIGGLVAAYIAYLGVADSLAMARENEGVAKDVLNTVERRLALGDATADELEQQRSALAVAQVNLAVLDNQLEDARTALAKMVGGLSSQVEIADQGLDALIDPEVQTGLPSELLFRRPDIKLMEARMRAANANIEVARAKLMPPMDLALQSGFSGLTLSQLVQPQSFFWSAAASLAVTIFDGGRRQGDKDYAQSYHEEMVENYRQTILQAVREVEGALSTLHSTSTRLQAQKRSARAALSMFNIANQAYVAGAVDVTALLESRKNYQRAKDELQRTRVDLLRAYASLSLSLGGSPAASVEHIPARYLVAHGDSEVRDTDSLASVNAAPWVLDLPGLYLPDSVQAVARDLPLRFKVDLSVTALVAERVGSVAEKGQSTQAWYRLSVYGWRDVDSASALCVRLQNAYQRCGVKTLADYLASNP